MLVEDERRVDAEIRAHGAEHGDASTEGCKGALKDGGGSKGGGHGVVSVRCGRLRWGGCQKRRELIVES